jgi:hypothetical protein
MRGAWRDRKCGAIDREPVEHFVGHVVHQFVDDLADRPGPGPVGDLLLVQPGLPPPEQREGFLHDGGFRGEATALDFFAHEMLPILGQRDVHDRYLQDYQDSIATPAGQVIPAARSELNRPARNRHSSRDFIPAIHPRANLFEKALTGLCPECNAPIG